IRQSHVCALYALCSGRKNEQAKPLLVTRQTRYAGRHEEMASKRRAGDQHLAAINCPATAPAFGPRFHPSQFPESICLGMSEHRTRIASGQLWQEFVRVAAVGRYQNLSCQHSYREKRLQYQSLPKGLAYDGVFHDAAA